MFRLSCIVDTCSLPPTAGPPLNHWPLKSPTPYQAPSLNASQGPLPTWGPLLCLLWRHFIHPLLPLLFITLFSSPHLHTSPWMPDGVPKTQLVQSRAHILIPKLNSSSVFPCSVSVSGPFSPTPYPHWSAMLHLGALDGTWCLPATE